MVVVVVEAALERVKRPSSAGWISRMRSPSGVLRTALVKMRGVHGEDEEEDVNDDAETARIDLEREVRRSTRSGIEVIVYTMLMMMIVMMKVKRARRC